MSGCAADSACAAADAARAAADAAFSGAEAACTGTDAACTVQHAVDTIYNALTYRNKGMQPCSLAAAQATKAALPQQHWNTTA